MVCIADKGILRSFLVTVLALACCLVSWAQTTKVRGTVTDASTGEPVPFVGVYFDGTTIGISTDMDGRYSIETRDPSATVLTAHLLGYLPQSIPVQAGAFTQVDFRLEPDRESLNAAVVKPDNRRLKRFLAELDAHRKIHDPERYERWSSRLYSKIELDATHAEELVTKTFLKKTFEPVLDYRDTSSVTGDSYIPIMISETVSQRHHSLEPAVDREVIVANRISGIEPDNFLSQFTGDYLLKSNFYKSTVPLFSVDVPSPVAAYGHAFYNYYLVDSMLVDGRKTYCLRFHPKKLISSPAFDGQMDIDAEDYAIRSVHVQLSKASNINWIRHVNIDQEHHRLPSGKWFPEDERLFMDFSIAVKDSSQVLSFLGNRSLHYGEPDFNPVFPEEVLAGGDEVLQRQGGPVDWAAERPYPLSQREEDIYTMVDRIQESRSYKWLYGITRSLMVGFIEIPDFPVSFGPWGSWVTRNETEGVHVGTGFRTTKDFSEKVRLSGSLGYGFKDRILKWGGGVEWMIRRDKTRKLSVSGKRDYSQLGQGSGVMSGNNMFNSLLGGHGTDRSSLLRTWKLSYEHEFSPSFSSTFLLESRRIFGNGQVPMVLRDGTPVESVSTNQWHYNARLSWDERINRGFFHKTYIYTRYPILSLDLIGGIRGITPDDYGFFRAEAALDWRVPGGAFGFGLLHLDAGMLNGSVPYPLLKLHEGNQGYFLDKGVFSCMDYFEFASDRWAEVFYEHNLNGLILGKLPLLRDWDWREVVTFKAAFGRLSDRNGKDSVMLPIEGLQSLEGAPYLEAGVGLSNILRIFRVDANWRLTHRDRRPFCVTLGLDVQF